MSSILSESHCVNCAQFPPSNIEKSRWLIDISYIRKGIRFSSPDYRSQGLLRASYIEKYKLDRYRE